MRIIALDVGEKRIGTAVADSNIRIALPRQMIPVDGNEFSEIAKLFMRENAKAIISGLPRNNSGEITRQTESVQNFISALKDYFEAQNITAAFAFQDESWTSEQAKDHIAVKKHAVTRQDRDSGTIDSEAATIILQDFLEGPRLHELKEKLK